MRILFSIIGLAAILRLVGLGLNPPSLYWDEVSLGWNAYSILKTGADEHGIPFPQVSFPAFGDQKPPGYIYATVPSVAVFGLNEFAVRFPSAIAGIVAVLLTYLLARRLFQRESIALIAALLLALSPWHIMVSRAAFEANLAATLVLGAVYCFVRGIDGRGWWFILTALLAASAMHTFNAQRVMVPLLFGGFAVMWWRVLGRKWKSVLFAAVLAGIFLFPLFLHLQTEKGRARFQEVSIFTDLEPIEQSNTWIEKDEHAWWARVIHNRRVLFAFRFLQHYFHHWNGMYLFVTGDMNPKFSVQSVGQLYLIELPFLLIGWYIVFRKKQKYRWLLLWWFLVAPIPAAMARETPHALRTLAILPTFQLIAAFGFVEGVRVLRQRWMRRSIVIGSGVVLASFVVLFLYSYWVDYPRTYAGVWQDGYKQAIEKAQRRLGQYDEVVMSLTYGRPYIYWLFYLQYDPKLYQELKRISQDQYGFYHVAGFGKFAFRDIAWEVESHDGKKLYIAPPGHFPENVKRLDSVVGRDGTSIFDLVEDG